MLLDFICELERVLGKWPANASWTLAQIADATESSVAQVVDIMSDTLERELEVHETLTNVDAAKALAVLKDRMSDQLAARERRQVQRREKAVRAYDVTMEKVRVLLATKNWRAAYKTLSYYVGLHEKDLGNELLLEMCGECLRLGFKAEANLQELSQWLRKGVTACLETGSPEHLADAFDFLDAYGAMFAEGDAMRGQRLMGNILETIRAQAESHNLMPQFAVLSKDLGVY